VTIGWGVSGRRGAKVCPFPLTLIVVLTTVLRYRVHYDQNVCVLFTVESACFVFWVYDRPTIWTCAQKGRIGSLDMPHKLVGECWLCLLFFCTYFRLMKCIHCAIVAATVGAIVAATVRPVYTLHYCIAFFDDIGWWILKTTVTNTNMRCAHLIYLCGCNGNGISYKSVRMFGICPKWWL